MVRLLIMHGADPLAEMGDKTPVEYAMAMKQEDICKYLQSELMFVDRVRVK